MTKAIPAYLAIAMFALATAGCVVNPVTHKQEFSVVSPQQEVEIGAQQYGPSQQSQGGRYDRDPALLAYVAEVGRKLAAVSDRPELPYEFVVLNNSTPNAWALPGGKIAVNRGLLTYLDNEAQLAAVLAHEIVHAAARHSASQMTRGTLIGAVAQVAGAVSQQSGLGQLGGAVAQVGSSAWMAHYGRGAELEADAYGIDYMVRAGYDPRAAVQIQQTFVKLSQGQQRDLFSSLFASHPPSEERVSANQAKVQGLAAGGATNRDRFQQKIARLKQDLPAYQEQEKAVKALTAKDPVTALAHLDKAIRLQPAEGQFWLYRGHALAMQKNVAEADKAYGAAIQKDPNYFMPYLVRGMLRFENKQHGTAGADLERANALLPTAPATFYLGELAYERGDRQQAAAYYQQAAQDQGEVGKLARARLAAMKAG